VTFCKSAKGCLSRGTNSVFFLNMTGSQRER
jgi:hypothetical protein